MSRLFQSKVASASAIGAESKPAGEGGDAAGLNTELSAEPELLSARVVPHPRELCFPIRRGQVVAFHNNVRPLLASPRHLHGLQSR